jgi:hypothetical protein
LLVDLLMSLFNGVNKFVDRDGLNWKNRLVDKSVKVIKLITQVSAVNTGSFRFRNFFTNKIGRIFDVSL